MKINSKILLLSAIGRIVLGYLILFFPISMEVSAKERVLNEFTSGKLKIRAVELESGSKIELRAVNREWEDLDLNLEMNLTNLRASEALPYRTILTSQSESESPEEVLLITLEKIQPRLGIKFSLSWSIFFGNPNAKNTGLYFPPVSIDRYYRIDNGFFGLGGHKKITPYAIDINMPEGTPVYAARSGRVVRLKKDGRIGGPGMEFMKHGNYIQILHDDGSYSSYAHFRFNGTIVEVGQFVNQGEQIGYSGNTGVSTGPHLHFDIQVADGKGGFRTVPWLFQDESGMEFEPKVGLWIDGRGSRKYDSDPDLETKERVN
jgi:murein DD-endopeptidase MepM/ murein hydrolase activator NlpD